jgi:putative methanogenesis marker protein 14
MGTTLAGQVINDEKPYANLSANYVGLAGGISDILLRGAGIIEEKSSTIDLNNNEKDAKLNDVEVHSITEKLHDFIDIMQVPSDVEQFGLVSVYSSKNIDSNIKIIGSRINDESGLIETFNDSVDVADYGSVMLQIDDFYAYFIKRLIEKTEELGLITSNMTLGITGRAGITGQKPRLIEEYLKDNFNEILFVEDGLALGALMMARCMNSLGTPTNPVGGSKKGFCIMQQRIQKNKH